MADRGGDEEEEEREERGKKEERNEGEEMVCPIISLSVERAMARRVGQAATVTILVTNLSPQPARLARLWVKAGEAVTLPEDVQPGSQEVGTAHRFTVFSQPTNYT